MDLVELLRSEARKHLCPACGKSMADCDINVLVHAGSQALVRVTCQKCADVTLLKLVIQTDEDAAEEMATAEPVRDAGRPQGVPALSADDVLDAKLALDAWDGDLRSLIGSDAA